MQDVRGAGILGVHGVVDLAEGGDGGVGTGGDEIHHLGGVVLESRELRQAGGDCHGVGAAVGHAIEGADALGDGVAALAGEIDELVELQVQIAEVGADDIPMRLLACRCSSMRSTSTFCRFA